MDTVTFSTPPPDRAFVRPLGEVLVSLFSGEELEKRVRFAEFAIVGNGLCGPEFGVTLRAQVAQALQETS